MGENLQQTVVRSQEPEGSEPASLAGSGGARRNIKHLREVVKCFLLLPWPRGGSSGLLKEIFFPRGNHLASGSALGVLEAFARVRE